MRSLSLAAALAAVSGLGASEAVAAAPRVQLDASDSVVVIGGVEERSAIFGEVRSVALGSSGEILVLDGVASRLVYFDSKGDHLAEVGREGDGPGEWRWPSGLDLDGTGTVRVLSQGSARIHRYALRPLGLELIGEERVDFLPRDLCTLEGRVFLLGLRRGLTIHEVNWEGEVVASFGPPVARPADLLGEWAPFTAEWTADGLLVCEEGSELIVHAPYRLPTISAYHLSGELAWQITLNEWSQGRWARVAEGPVRAAPDPETGKSSGMVSAVKLDPGQLLLQYRDFAAPGDPNSPSELLSVLVQLREGTHCRGSAELPQVLEARGERVAWLSDSLMPEVTVGHIEVPRCR